VCLPVAAGLVQRQQMPVGPLTGGQSQHPPAVGCLLQALAHLLHAAAAVLKLSPGALLLGGQWLLHGCCCCCCYC
jgi:hypothetical protein